MCILEINFYKFLQGAYLWTPVLLASDENQIHVLELLIHHGAQLNIRDEVNIMIVLSLSTHCSLVKLLTLAGRVYHYYIVCL